MNISVSMLQFMIKNSIDFSNYSCTILHSDTYFMISDFMS